MKGPHVWDYASLVVAAICYGSIPVFSYYLNRLNVPTVQQAFFRALFAVMYLSLGIGVFGSFRRVRISRAHLPLFLVYSLIGIALSIVAYITSMAIGTPVVVAVSLTYLYPVWTIILARLFLKEPLNWLRLIAVPLSLAGAIVVSLPSELQITAVPIAGILWTIANGGFAACYVVFGRNWARLGYNPTTTTFWGYSFATLWMVPILLAFPLFLTDPRVVGFPLLLPPAAWVLLLAFALVGTALPYALVNVGVKGIDASVASIILLLDPISAVVMGYLFMQQSVNLWQFLGASLILLATLLVAIESRVFAHRVAGSSAGNHIGKS
jgi:drug/metabolite transporter (DMT)-like permease